MGKRNVSISYLADIDTLYVHFESKAGFYDAIPGDDHVQARYDEDGKVIGFMVEGLKDIQGGWTSNWPMRPSKLRGSEQKVRQ